MRRKCPLCNEAVPYGHQLRVNIALRSVQTELEKKAGPSAAAEETSRTEAHELTPAAVAMPSAAPMASQSEATRRAAEGGQAEPSHAGGRAAAGMPPSRQASDGAVRPSSAGTASTSVPLPAGADVGEAPSGRLEARGLSGLQSGPASSSRDQQRWHRRSSAGAAADSDGPWFVSRRRPALPATAMAEGMIAAAAQLALWALCSPRAGSLRDCLWVVAGVALPPALVMWGHAVLWVLLLAAAALVLAAHRRWRLLALLLGGAAALDAVSWLLKRVQRWWPQPAATGWPDYS